MTYEELKALRQEGVELGKKGLFQDAQIKLYRAFNSSEDMTEFHLDVGLDLVCVYRRMESWNAALELIDYIADHESAGNYYVALAYLDRALIDYNQRDFETALEAIREAENLFNEDFPVKKHWYLSMVKGRVHFAQDQFSEAATCYTKALELCHVSESTINLQESYLNLGEVLIVMDRLDEGVDLVQKAISINQRADEFLHLAINYQTLMFVSFKKGDLNAAKEYASHCLKLAYTHNFRSVVRDTCHQIGRYYKHQGRSDIAEVFFKKASNADERFSPELLRELDIDIVNSRGTSMGER